MLGFGWFATIVIGAIAGWLMEKVMKVDLKFWKSALLGILGGVLGGAVISLLGASNPSGWIGGVLVSALGACLIMFVYKKLIKKL